MKPESLEALLLDQALGELSPEVTELLEAHLARSPESAAQSRELASTAILARESVALTRVAPQRRLDVDRLRIARVANRRRAFAGELLRLAACVLLGLTMGWRGQAILKPTEAPTSAPIAAVAGARPGSHGGTADLWSLANFEEVQREQQHAAGGTTGRYRLNWGSPFKMPHLEDNQ